MKFKSHQSSQLSQRGFVAVLILVTIALSAVTAITVNLWGNDPTTLQKTKTRLALKQAKEAVLAYVELGPMTNLGGTALLDSTGGRLPCPNLIGDGTANNTASTAQCELQQVSKLGLLPFAEFGIQPLLDATNECLWMAVDGNFKIAGVTAISMRGINSDSNGQFTVIQPTKITSSLGQVSWTERVIGGSTTVPSQRIVAVIFAPGTARAGQVRPIFSTLCPVASTTPATNYLDSYLTAVGAVTINNSAMPLANSVKTFVQSDTNHELLNDELIWITADEFAKAASRRALRVVSSLIENFVYGNPLSGENINPTLQANGFYPPPAAVPGGACIAGRVQGYVPGSCGGFAGLPNFDLGNRLNPAGTVTNRDPEGWLSHMHYAVSAACTGTTATRVRPTVPVTSPCLTNPIRMTVGADTATVQALLLIRGRNTAGACSNNPSNAAVVPILAPCIDGANQAAITNPNPALNVAYSLPAQNSRNQMHLFRGR